jgi:TetR/AcrR family transcriptional repressor of nem operon
MRKGDITRDHIIEESAKLLNKQGYFGLSISDIMRATGLQKGGIYNHFETKDEIAKEAFSYAVSVVSKRFREAAASKKTAYEQLLAVLAVYENVVYEPPFTGGCPVMNMAIESDDAHPELREKAKDAMAEFLNFVESIVRRGIEQGEFKTDLDLDALSSLVTSCIEGGVMLSKLFGNNRYIRQNIRLLTEYINVCVCRH